MNYQVYGNELYHHGILGQKWGVRRFQNPDGSLTPAGRKRYGTLENYSRYENAKKSMKKSKNAYYEAYNKADSYENLTGGRLNPFSSKVREKSKANWADVKEKRSVYTNNKELYNRIKKEVKEDVKIKATKEQRDAYRSEMISRTKGNKRLQDFYANATEEELQERIDKQQKMKKILYAAAIGTAAGVGVYAAYRAGVLDDIQKMIKDNPTKSTDALKKAAVDIMQDNMDDIDYILDKGSKLHRMNGFENFDLNKANDAIFAAADRADYETYKALLANPKGAQGRWDVTLEALDSIKAPSRSKARQIFDELYQSDPSIKKEIMNQVQQMYEGRGLSPTLARQLAKDEISTRSFETAVKAFASNGRGTSKFAEALKNRGYNAIMDYHDIDDQLTKNPIILLDKNVLKVGNERVVTAADKLDALKFMKNNNVTAYQNPQMRYAIDQFIRGGEELIKQYLG